MADKTFHTEFNDKVNPLNVLSFFGFSNGLFISNNTPVLISFSSSNGEGSMEITYTCDTKGRLTTYSAIDPEDGLVKIEVDYKNQVEPNASLF